MGRLLDSCPNLEIQELRQFFIERGKSFVCLPEKQGILDLYILYALIDPKLIDLILNLSLCTNLIYFLVT